MEPDWIADDETRAQFDPGLICLFLLLVIAPLKFGAIVGTGGIPLYPSSTLEWLVGLWPPCLAAAFSGLCLLIVSWYHRRELPERTLAGWFPVLPAAILLLGAIPGFIGTTEWAYAVPMAWHLAGVLAIAMAVHVQVSARPESVKWLLIAIVIGGLLCCWGTIEQVLWGFENTRKLVESMVQSGQRVPGPLLNRASQTRAFAYFTYPNNLAAHFLVVIPIMMAAAHRFGRNFEPVKVSTILLPLLTLALTGWCIRQTDSLAALVAATGAVGGTLIYSLLASGKKGSGKLFIALILVGAIAGGILLSKNSRRLKSAGARLDYYRSAVQMLADNPAKGVGWGEFYPWYMRLKAKGAEETRLPHNLLLSFASQAGALGALGAIAFLLQPFWLVFGGRKLGWDKRQYWHIPITLALFGWLAHSLADFNLMIPGTLITIATLGPLMLARSTRKEPVRLTKPPTTSVWIPLTVGVLVASAFWMIPGEKAYQDLESSLRQGNLPLARKQLAKATRLMPHSPHPEDFFARVMSSRGHWDEAARHWEAAVARAPHRSGLHLRLAETYLAAGNLHKAEASLKTARIWYPHSENLVRIEAALNEQKRLQPQP